MSYSVSAFDAPAIPKEQSYTHWEQRREMMLGGKIKRIADQCQKLTQRHSDMSERANGWLYRFSVPYGGSDAFIDRRAHFNSEKRILEIHSRLQEENRWERHGAAVHGALDRCKRNYDRAHQMVINIMEKFGARYNPVKNDWDEDF